MNLISYRITGRFRQVLWGENLYVVVAMFNCALLMHFLLAGRGIFVATVAILLINHRLWFISLINVLVGTGLFLFAFPRQGNHANLELFLCLTMLSLFASQMGNFRVKISPEMVSTSFRAFTIAVYMHAGFHKLNWDFFDVSVSCANIYGDEFVKRILNTSEFSLPYRLKSFVPYSTIFLEMILPLGLLWSFSRKSVAIFLLVFHLYLAMYGFVNFSAFACFLLLGCLIDFANNEVSGQTILGLKLYLGSVLLCALLNVTRLISVEFDTHFLLVTFGAIFCFGATAFFTLFFRDYKKVQHGFDVRLLIAFVVIFFL